MNKGKKKGRGCYYAPASSFCEASLLLLFYYYYYYYYYCCPGGRYVAPPALRIASMPSSALSSTVVLALLR